MPPRALKAAALVRSGRITLKMLIRARAPQRRPKRTEGLITGEETHVCEGETAKWTFAMAASMDAGSVLALAPSPSQSFLLTSNDVQRDMEELTRSMASIDTNDEGVSNGRSAAEQIWNRRTSEPTSISDPNEEDDLFDRYMANPPAAPSSDSSSSAALRSPTDVGSSVALHDDGSIERAG